MTDRTAQSSRSATEVNNYGIAQAFKRTRCQYETPTTPRLQVTDALGFTTSTESIETVVDTYAESRTRNTARKLDRLYDKQDRFESHQQFLKRCLEAQVIPNGLLIELEPSIGNHDEEFLAKWNEKLIRFSRELTEDVIEFCGKTVKDTTAKIAPAKEDLKSSTNETQLKEITASLEKNRKDRTYHLKRNKDKKFYRLKFNVKPRSARQQQATSDEEWSDNGSTPRQNQQGRNLWNKRDNTTGEDNGNPPRNHRDQQQQRQQKSRKNSRTNLFYKPRSRNNSQTTLNVNHEPRDNNSLLERVRQLEAQLQKKPDLPATVPKPQINTVPNTRNANPGSPSNRDPNQKNVNGAPSHTPGATPQIHDMLNYITATMETLNSFKQHLTTVQNTNPTPTEM